MRVPGNIVHCWSQDIHQLRNKPDHNYNQRGHLDYTDNENEPEQALNPCEREKPQVSRHYSCKSSTRSYNRCKVSKVSYVVCYYCRQATNDIKHHEPEVSHALFHVVAVNPDKSHVTDKVQPAPVQEHRSY